MFCIQEITVMQDISAVIVEGKTSDPSIQSVVNLFPSTYATFELVILFRIFYFLLFNTIACGSLTFVQDPNKEKIILGDKMIEQQAELSNLTQKLGEFVLDRNLPIEKQLLYKDYVAIRNSAIKTIGNEVFVAQGG